MKQKRIISLLLLVALCLGLTACGGTSTPTASVAPDAESDTDSAEDAKSDTGSTEGVSQHTFLLSLDGAEDTVAYSFAERFAQEVSDASDGLIEIQLYPNATLGGDSESIESCITGQITFVVQTTAPQVAFMPELAIFDLPMAYTDIDEVRAAVDNEEMYATLQGIYNESRLVLLGYADQGFRVMSSNVKVESVEDLSGIKIRTMENSNHIAFWNALGANATPMAFSEVYIGLQQGTIDAQENPVEEIVSSKFYEQQDYIINTNHLPHLVSLIMSGTIFDGLSAEEQEIITAAAEAAKEYARQESDNRIADRLKTITDSGTEIVELSEPVLTEMKERASDIYADIRAQVGDDLVDAWLSAGN